MPDPSPFALPHRPSQTGAGIPLPAHIYGTRAALFHLLRETAPAPFAGPAAEIVALPAQGPGPARPRAAPLQVVPSAGTTVPARSALGDMLQSDNFDFRSFGSAD